MEAARTAVTRTGVHLAWASRTVTGKVRRVNEDHMLGEAGVFVVADGMGGHEAGDVASRTAVSVFEATVGSPPGTLDGVQSLVSDANREIRDRARRSHRGRMGTTLVAALLFDNAGRDGFVVLNVGDSRCYSYSESGGFECVTHDHSVVQEMIDDGLLTPPEAKSHPHRSVVTRALGVDSEVNADFFVLPSYGRQRLLLCSDGVSGQVDAQRIEALLAGEETPAVVADRLIDDVLSGAAPDNATAMVVDLEWPSGDQRPDGDVDEATGPRPRQRDGASPNALIEAVPRSAGESRADASATGTPRRARPSVISEVP